MLTLKRLVTIKIPWDIMNLSIGEYEKEDKFNDLFLNFLGQHAPIYLFTQTQKYHPCFNGEIKQRIIAKKKLHRKAR